MPAPSSAGKEAWRPLAGVRVLEIAPYLPGPHAGQLLAELGADVIKIEPPGGDPARALQGGLYTANNRGKRSVCVNLKSADAAPVLARLAAWVEVVIEGHKPGVAARLGIDYETLRAHQPRLVYAALSGYGQTGPDAQLPGHDINYLAAGGALARSGHWRGSPRRSGLPLADLAGSLHAALAIVAAVHEARMTGRGRYLDISLTAAVLRLAGARGIDAAPRAHLHPTNDLFTTSDHQTLAAALIEDHFYARFAAALAGDYPELAEPHYATVAERQAAGDALHALLARVFANRTLEAWLMLAHAHALPLSAVRDAPAAHAALYAGLAHPPLPVITDAPAFIAAEAPDTGAHTSAVLAELGFRADELARFLDAGVIHAPR